MAVTDTPVKSAQTTFSIVETIDELDGATLSELVDHLGTPKSTVHDHVSTLVQLGYLVQDGDEYRVSCRFLELGGRSRKRMKIYRMSHPEVQRLAIETGEHANLMIEENGQGIFLYKAKGEDAVQLDTYVGMRVNLQTTALGKSMLAYMPEERVEEILDQHGLPEVTEHTVSTREELYEELEEIRERGYATDDGERVERMRCVAAPLKTKDDEVLGAISVSGPRSRMQGERFESEIPNKVLQAANVLEVNLKYS